MFKKYLLMAFLWIKFLQFNFYEIVIFYSPTHLTPPNIADVWNLHKFKSDLHKNLNLNFLSNSHDSKMGLAAIFDFLWSVAWNSHNTYDIDSP